MISQFIFLTRQVLSLPQSIFVSEKVTMRIDIKNSGGYLLAGNHLKK